MTNKYKSILSVFLTFLFATSLAKGAELGCKVQTVIKKNEQITRHLKIHTIQFDGFGLAHDRFPIEGTDFSFVIERDSTSPELIKEFPNLIGYTGKVEHTLTRLMILEKSGALDNFVFIESSPYYYFSKNLSLNYQLKTPDGFQWMFVSCVIQ